MERSPFDTLLESHEERIQRSEAFIPEVSAQMAALTEQLKAVGDKVAEVGESLSNDISEFRKTNAADHNSLTAQVAALKVSNESHSKTLETLLSDREQARKRLEFLKKALVWGVLAVLGGVATRWGEAIYSWLTGHGK